MRSFNLFLKYRNNLWPNRKHKSDACRKGNIDKFAHHIEIDPLFNVFLKRIIFEKYTQVYVSKFDL